MLISIRKGLDLPISGRVDQALIEQAAPVRRVAVLGPDYIDLNPAMQVDEGDDVRCGQVLFTHKKLPDVQFTAPGAGRITAIHRGARRRLLSVVIQLAAAGNQKEEGGHAGEE